jgi:hypothetical protein
VTRLTDCNGPNCVKYYNRSVNCINCKIGDYQLHNGGTHCYECPIGKYGYEIASTTGYYDNSLNKSHINCQLCTESFLCNKRGLNITTVQLNKGWSIWWSMYRINRN